MPQHLRRRVQAQPDAEAGELARGPQQVASLDGGWEPVDQITQNVLRRLSCPYPSGPQLANVSFEQYDAEGHPVGWTLEGAGSVGAAAVNVGHTPLQVDATAGQTWISQGPLLLEYGNQWAAGCWAKAEQSGATIRLQSTATWQDFAIAEHPGDGNWHYLFAVGMPGAGETPVFPARVKIQVASGLAYFDNVHVQALGPRHERHSHLDHRIPRPGRCRAAPGRLVHRRRGPGSRLAPPPKRPLLGTHSVDVDG